MSDDLGKSELFVENEKKEQFSYGGMAAGLIKTSAIATLHTVSYLAGTAVEGADLAIKDMVPWFIRIPSAPSWLPIESISILSTVSPLLTLGADIRSMDPTGAAEMFLAINAAKTTLKYTKIAADITAAAIETGSVKETMILGVQSIANSYVPSNIRNMVGLDIN